MSPRPKTTSEVAKDRSCLKCQKMFKSTGIGNRICSRCSEVNKTIMMPKLTQANITPVPRGGVKESP